MQSPLTQDILIREKNMPFCPGCGYPLTTRTVAGALKILGLKPLDVVLVSDIGCCGLIDSLLGCHTVHGLHGRAAALAFGVAQGLADSGKKVIAFQGDGGATIGLQHLLEAARRNVDMTLIVQNNMVYGMTGGQVSGLSPQEVKEWKLPEDAPVPPFDICRLAHTAGASFAARIIERGDFSEILAEAMGTPGFSLLEVVGPCPAHGIAKIKEIAAEEIVLKNPRPAYRVAMQEKSSLFAELQQFGSHFSSPLKGRHSVIIAGSAGEGIQSAADLLAGAAVLSGLHATKKGDYPVTVGTGFSVAEVILSRDEIHHTGIDSPDTAIVVSEDGLNMVRSRITGGKTQILLDGKLDAGFPGAEQREFRRAGGKKGAALCAIAYWLQRENLFPIDALKQAAGRHKLADRFLEIIEKASTL